ncbi:protein CNPPD1 [Trichonephila clavipes]|nr:protein CNPPD1 [Trichonephila clavipes]
MQIKVHDVKNQKKEIRAEIGMLQKHLFYCRNCEIRLRSILFLRQGYLRMSQQRGVPESMAWRVMGRLESGQTQCSVADAVGVARSVVARLWNRFQETGNVRRRSGAGRPRATTSTDDWYIQLTARRNRTENATQLQRQLLLATGRRVSSQTVHNRLHEALCTLECDTRRVLVWRDRGTRNNPAFVRERLQYKRAGWMVWGGISIGGRMDLHIIRNGTLTGRRYADEILRPHVIPYAGAIGDSLVFQDDNAQPLRARLVENMLEAETIQLMEWPACSPDLNPIEYVWYMLGRRIAARPRLPATVRDLENALLEEWNSIPQSLIDNLIASMANRIAVKQSSLRNWASYSDINVIVQSEAFRKLFNIFLKKFLKMTVLWTLGYVATAVILYCTGLTLQKLKSERLLSQDFMVQNNTIDLQTSVQSSVDKTHVSDQVSSNIETSGQDSTQPLFLILEHRDNLFGHVNQNRNNYSYCLVAFKKKSSAYKIKTRPFSPSRLEISSGDYFTRKTNVLNDTFAERVARLKIRQECIPVLLR